MQRQLIKDLTRIEHHITHIRRLLRKWGLKPKIPHKVHTTAASTFECKKWRRYILRMIKRATHRGYKTFIQDEVIFNDNAVHMAKYWTNVDERLILPWNGTRSKFVVYGMISLEGETFFRSDDKFNGSTFIKDVHQKYDKIMLIVDMAHAQRSERISKEMQW